MKLLGWMHRKFRQNSADAFKDYVATAPSCNCLCVWPPLEENHHGRRRSVGSHGLFSSSELAEGGGESVMFEGLLTIGTMGSVPVEVDEEVAVVEPVTAEEIAEKAAEEAATEAELMVVGAELEKVLAAEAEKEGSERLSSARPSHASGKGGAACPLQGYLFGSPIEVAETAGLVGRKDRRASLGELFMMNRVAEEEKGDGGDVKATPGMMVKKMLRRRGPSKASSSSDGGPAESATKFHKIMRTFLKKVHPENTLTTKKINSSYKHKNRENNISHDGDNDSDGGIGDGGPSSFREDGNPSFKSHSIGGGSDSSGSREYWIKTDSDYLVLEL